MAFLQNGTFRMHYELHRGLVPRDTLLIHGNAASNRWWQPAVEEWAKIREREDIERKWSGSLILAEWRGCGRSSGPSSEADLKPAALAKDYLELLQSLGISRANLIAHSIGCFIGLEALRLGPEVFERAVLLSPANSMPISMETRMEIVSMSRDRARLEQSLDRAIHLNEFSSPFFQQLVDDGFNAHPLVWAGILSSLEASDFASKVREVGQSTLVLHGDQDAILPVGGAMEIAGLLREGQFQLLQGQGHSCQIENPGLFAMLAHRFLFG